MTTLTYRKCPCCGTTSALPDSQRWCGFCERGYRAAVADAVEAVKALTTYGEFSWGLDQSDYGDYIKHDDATAAIEALVDTPQQELIEHIKPTGYDPITTDNRP